MLASKFAKKIKHNRFLLAFFHALVHGLLHLLIATYRLRVTYDPAYTTDDGVFYAWHQNIIASAAFFIKQKKTVHCIISPSRDGKFAGSIAQKFNLTPIYGSAHKEPIALVRKSLRVLKDNKKIFLIGDGSRGPAKKLQPGVQYLAQRSKLPMIFMECDVQWKFTLQKSWDKFQIPLPFSKIHVHVKKQLDT